MATPISLCSVGSLATLKGLPSPSASCPRSVRALSSKRGSGIIRATNWSATPRRRQLVVRTEGQRRRALRVCAAAQNGCNENVVVSVTYLTDIVFRAIRTFGYTEEEAQSLQDVMMYAQLRGNNQGIIKITTGTRALGFSRGCKKGLLLFCTREPFTFGVFRIRFSFSP
jgi:hypothetical protein